MLITYKTFNDPELVRQLAILFEEHSIEYETEDDSKIFDASFSFNPATRCIAVNIKQEDFEKANQLLSEISRSEINSISKDHYLFNFSDEELLDIIKKPDEWSPLDFELSKNILRDRKIEIRPNKIQELRKERIVELSRPETDKSNNDLLACLFILSGTILLTLAPRPVYFVFNMFGIMMAALLFQSKKTLPDGQRVFRYAEADRKQGRFIFILGILLTAAAFVIAFTKF